MSSLHRLRVIPPQRHESRPHSLCSDVVPIRAGICPDVVSCPSMCTLLHCSVHVPYADAFVIRASDDPFTIRRDGNRAHISL
jgi:hypothetical protein